MAQCIKCQQSFQTTATTGRPSEYCSQACRRAAGYEVERINKRLADLEDHLIQENLHKGKDKSKNACGQTCPERIAALQKAILESESRLKLLLSAKKD